MLLVLPPLLLLMLMLLEVDCGLACKPRPLPAQADANPHPQDAGVLLQVLGWHGPERPWLGEQVVESVVRRAPPNLLGPGKL
jgi:hypothetical protein